MIWSLKFKCQITVLTPIPWFIEHRKWWWFSEIYYEHILVVLNSVLWNLTESLQSSLVVDTACLPLWVSKDSTIFPFYLSKFLNVQYTYKLSKKKAWCMIGPLSIWKNVKLIQCANFWGYWWTTNLTLLHCIVKYKFITAPLNTGKKVIKVKPQPKFCVIIILYSDEPLPLPLSPLP